MYDHDMLIAIYITANKGESSSSSTDVTLEATGAANSDSDKVSGCNFKCVFLWLPYYRVT